MAGDHTVHDCLIVGAGAGGCAAATYLARFCRDVVLADAGESRLDRIPLTRNTPGFPEGIEGSDLHERLRRQALAYGAVIKPATVERLLGAPHGFDAETNAGIVRARTVLIATGVKVTEPPIANLETCVREGLIRYCPICDGYEVRNKRVVVLGASPQSISEAHFLTTFTDQVSFVAFRTEAYPEGAAGDEARAAGIELAPFSPDLKLVRDGNTVVVIGANTHVVADALYPCLGVTPNAALAQDLGARVGEDGALITDAHQRTSVENVYAAGDVTVGIDQIASAFGQAAIAACAIHNLLRDKSR